MSAASDRARDKYLQRTYGLSLAQFLKMMLRQGRKCAICGRHFNKYKAFVDHAHKNMPDAGRVRGILCFLCNKRLLGRGNENPTLHEVAAKYLTSTFDGRKL